MNQPPKPDDSIDLTTYQSLPAPPSLPVVSIKVPSLTPGGPDRTIPVPNGAQVVIPGEAVPIAHLAFKWALPLSAVIVCGVLVALDKVPAAYFTTLIGIIFGIQIPEIKTHAPPTVIDVTPKGGNP